MKISVDRTRCNECGLCANSCVYGALTVIGHLMTVDDVLDEVLRDADFYRQSGGGVTASGGEPLMQGEFVAELFKSCQEKGLHTTLDTCGYASRPVLRKVLKHTNLVLFDIKFIDDSLHRRFTGVSNKKILRNVKEVDALGVPQIIRIPLIPSANGFEQNLIDTAHFVEGLKHKTPIDLLPYHRMALSKYDSLDRCYELKDEAVPSEDYLHKMLDLVKATGAECQICY